MATKKSVASKTTPSKARNSKKVEKPAAQAATPPAKRPVWTALCAVCLPIADVQEAELEAMAVAPQAAAYPHMKAVQEKFDELMKLVEKHFPGTAAVSSLEPIADFRKAAKPLRMPTQLYTGLPLGISWSDGSQNMAWIGAAECTRFFNPEPEPTPAPQESAKPAQVKNGNGKGKKKLPEKPEEISDDPADYAELSDADIRAYVAGQPAELQKQIKLAKRGAIKRETFIPQMAQVVNTAILAAWEAECAAA